MNPIYKARRRRDIIIRVLCCGAALFGVTWLALILFTLLFNGVAGLSLQLFTENTPPLESLQRLPQGCYEVGRLIPHDPSQLTVQRSRHGPSSLNGGTPNADTSIACAGATVIAGPTKVQHI